ncbi:capsule biosynthesis protein [Sulfitobacter pacificus]|uniref:capsule biosynthesis protein n=1 Tax=Sulfitobacter pacificus TaxID=1499314 RepID=UPI0033429442
MAESFQEEAQLISRVRHLKHSAPVEAQPRVVVPRVVSGGDLAEPAPPRPAGPVIPKFDIRPPARRAKPRKRHRFLVFTFMLFVVSPIVLASYYLWTQAADQYASRVAFSVRTEEQTSAIELLGGITELSGSSSSDTDILFAYLSSQELVSRVDQKIGLREVWSRVSIEQDPIFAFDPAGTIEDLQDHWERKISIIYDSSTGLIELEVLAFDPQDALRVAQAILAECTAMINGLSRIAQEDSIRFTREELANSVERLKVSRRALTQFRNRTQIVDPSIDTQNQMGLLVTLQQQLAEALIDHDLLQDTTRENDPRITQAKRRIEVIEERISSERGNLGLGVDGESGDAFANLVGEYEGLIVDREFAEAAYVAALAAHDSALAEVRKQSRYLAAHVKPTLAQRAEFPKRELTLALIALFSFFTWSILSLVYYSLRDRS